MDISDNDTIVLSLVNALLKGCVKTNTKSAIQSWIRDRIKPNETDEKEGNTIVHLFASNDIFCLNKANNRVESEFYLAIMDIILKNGCKRVISESARVRLDKTQNFLNIYNNHGLLPIHLACQENNVCFLRFMIIQGYINETNATVITEDGNELTPLSIAIKNNAVDCVNLLCTRFCKSCNLISSNTLKNILQNFSVHHSNDIFKITFRAWLKKFDIYDNKSWIDSNDNSKHVINQLAQLICELRSIVESKKNAQIIFHYVNSVLVAFDNLINGKNQFSDIAMLLDISRQLHSNVPPVCKNGHTMKFKLTSGDCCKCLVGKASGYHCKSCNVKIFLCENCVFETIVQELSKMFTTSGKIKSFIKTISVYKEKYQEKLIDKVTLHVVYCPLDLTIHKTFTTHHTL